ncbi:MAG: hypothetical protein Q7S33_05335 [Nanoarchaeota archaeon]|nr:hypothetical protein [Nanoarchaeota archaeon]
MPTISKEKKDKISEQILFYLYQVFPKQIFISDIAKELARDEEFIKALLEELLKKDLVIKIDKNEKGIVYSRRTRWRLSNKVHSAYSNQQIQ